MLISLEIENFKGIAARQRIDFAPLTLMFGANSAGKSTILQALLYLHELIERGSADVDRTELGGAVLELGGFARLVHRHDTERAIVLRAEFATPGRLDPFGRDLTDFPFPDLDDDIESAWLELTIRFRTTPTFRGPLVERAVIGVNGGTEPLVWLETGSTLRDGELLQARVNLGHPLLATEARELTGALVTDADGTQRRLTVLHAPADLTEDWEQIAAPEEILHQALEAEGGGEGWGGGYGGGIGAGAGLGDGRGFGDERSLPVFALARARLSALPAPGEPLRVIPFGHDSPEMAATALQVRTFLEMVVLGTTAQLASFLREAMYIGPLRTVPPRGFLYERAGRVTSWADGLAAWDLLLADRFTLVDRTNDWLKRLGAGCKVVVQQLFEPGTDAEDLSDGHVDKTVRRLLLDTGAGSFVLPSEVGAGISQIIPVVVAALEGRYGLSLVEQPEIHVHPAVQVGLGDLFIEAVTREGSRRTLLVETHSEHLILRLLRRIRETTEKELDGGAPAFTEGKLSVLYVESTPEGVRVRRLRVDERGEFVDPWPKGFFAERMEELLIHAFALEPRLVATWGRREEFRFIHDKFGLGTPRALLELPSFSKWKKAVYEAAKDLALSQAELKRIEELFRIFGEHKCRRADSIYDGLLSWLENAEREYDRKPFAAILAAQNPRGHHGVLVSDQLDGGSARWACESGASPARTPEALAAALSAMLTNCKQLHLVDPHFGPENRRHRTVLEALMNVLGDHALLLDVVRVHCSGKSTLSSFEQEAAKMAGRLPSGCTVEFVRWKEKPEGEKLHNRYVLTEIGGVALGIGLDAGGRGETDDLLLLPRAQYAHRWSQYAGNDGAFECVDRPTKIVGTRAGRPARR